MVNHGISRACLTCKARRTKCDEQKPSCRKCTKSKRTCLGYKDNADILFRDSSLRGAQATPKLALALTKSKTSAHIPSSNSSPNVTALNIFFEDYVLTSQDRSLSCGYLDGLPSFLAQQSCASTLLGAANLVANSSLESKSGTLSPFSTSTQYSALLSAFQKSLDNPAKCNADEALMTAVLLGLYELIIASEPYPDAHGTHLRGISAILCTRKQPFEVLELAGSSLFELFNPLLPTNSVSSRRIPGLLSPYPIQDTDPSMKSLDVLLIKSHPVLQQASRLLSHEKATKAELRSLKRDAGLLNKEFALWPLCQPKQWLPKTLGILKKTRNDGGESYFWDGKVDEYFDLYVAAVWNIYRKARLKLIDVIFKASKGLDLKATMPQKLMADTQGLVDELCASVPFHLLADLPAYLRNGNAEKKRPGKALGGLLLMYPLYIASSLSMVPTEQREWMKGRLRWIGRVIGIRQASMLADVN